ncbi:hypothetical protein [Azospirillum sp. Marseille-Q6669]
MTNTNHWCFAWMPELATSGKSRGALLKANMWKPGDVITVSFLDGDPDLQKRVRDVAREWTTSKRANLTLDFREGPDMMIRISFRYRGSWSTVGRGCLQITDKTQPTMNYGWLKPDSDDVELRRVVLHEFGHALGMIHEHQNPDGAIDWDREAVRADLSGPPNNWDDATIERNMFEAFKEEEVNATKVDPHSIMMYVIPTHWTRNGISAGLNDDLSPMDEKFIHAQYPF